MAFDAPAPVPDTFLRRKTLLQDIISKYQDAPDRHLKMIEGFGEYLKEDRRALSTTNTVFELAILAINESDGCVDETVGALTDALDLTPDQLHHISCDCHGTVITPELAALRWADVLHMIEQDQT